MPLPNQRNYELAHELAYKLARERLAKIEDIEQQCRKADAKYQRTDPQEIITINYLNQPYLITLPEAEISLVDSQDKVPIRDKVLILHYFTSAKGTSLANKFITYKELPGGNTYFPTFAKRTTKPILKYFNQNPHYLIPAAANLGGYKADYGDVAVTINAFRRVPITIVLWQGDDELAPEGSVMFDATISDYLSSEDITILCETITWKLISYLRESATSH